MENWLNFSDTVKAFWEFLCGIAGIVLGYFLPIRDMVNFIVLLFLIDVFLGYLAAKKLRGEKFSTRIIWRTTMPRMLISLLLIVVAYMWDTIFKQEFVQTYNLVAWFVAGVLIFSIGKNGYKITKWEVFSNLTGIFQKKIQEQTGIDIEDSPL